MKKALFFIIILSMTLPFNVINAQTVIFEETFDSTADNEIPANWEAIDRSGTFFKWNVGDWMADSYGFSGKTASLLSINTTSDELLVSPAVNLQAGSSYSLAFLIGTLTAGGVWQPDNHYAVYILPSGGSFTGTETPVLEEDITTGNNAESKSINLSSFAGQDIKIYFRQFNSSNPFGVMLLDTVKITQEPLLEVSETSLASELTIYPNPAADYIYLKCKSKIIKAEIFDMMGKKMNTVLKDNKIDLQGLVKGTYIINITTSSTNYSKKFIKN